MTERKRAKEELEKSEARFEEAQRVARIGGDEFTLLLEDINSPLQATRVAEKVLSAFNEPFELEGRDHACHTQHRD